MKTQSTHFTKQVNRFCVSLSHTEKHTETFNRTQKKYISYVYIFLNIYLVRYQNKIYNKILTLKKPKHIKINKICLVNGSKLIIGREQAPPPTSIHGLG